MKLRHLTIGFAAAALLAAGCGKKDKDKPAGGPTGGTTTKDPAGGGPTGGPGGGDTTELAKMVADQSATIGVEPGALEPEADQGADAALTDRKGTVAIRRAGEDAFTDAPAGEVELHAGDQIRTEADSTATLVLADETTVELAEESAVAIGNRDASADPASAVAVLAGVARFTVSPRGAGEGPFTVHTPGGIVAAKGTVFVVGVAATGVARVGVEEGDIEVAGRADLAAPVAVATGSAATVSAQGKVEGGVQFASDDWGEWRDGVEAEVEPQAVVEAQVASMAELEKDVAAAYAELEELNASVETEIATAAEAEAAADTAAYEAVAEPLATDVEATYLASLRLQNLTFALLASAYVTGEINARFPEQTETVVVRARPRMVGALLWHKKYHVVVHHHVRPLRVHYYVHHPVGRTRAVVVKHKVPAFYSKIVLRPIDPVRVRGRVKVAVYTPPVVIKFKPGKRVWVTAPARGWHAKVKAKPFKLRAAGHWYVRPAAPRAKVIAGVKVKARPPRVFVHAKPAPIGRVNIKFGGGGGVRVKGGAGGGVKVKTGGGADARVKVGGPAGGVVVDHRGPDVKVKTGADAKAGVKVGPGGVTVKVKEKGEPGKTTVRVGPGGGVTVKGKADDKTKVKVGPGGGIKIKGEAKGGIKIGPKKNP